MADSDMEDDLAAYVATLFPFQQQAIATAQLAGCRFEQRATSRSAGWENELGKWRFKSIDTTEYEAFLPDAQSLGCFEDIYEGAVRCLALLNADEAPRRGALDDGAFALQPENEQ